MKIIDIENYLNAKLPKSYIDFMLKTNGGNFNDIHIYNSEELIERNECYETQEYASGWFTVGDDGGGMAFMMSLDENSRQVYKVDHGSMDPNDFELVTSNFNTWIDSGFK